MPDQPGRDPRLRSAADGGQAWVRGVRVRRAAAFIDKHAGRAVTVRDIAAAADLTPRALYGAFRRRYDLELLSA